VDVAGEHEDGTGGDGGGGGSWGGLAAAGAGVGTAGGTGTAGAGAGVIALAWNDHTRDSVEAHGKLEKIPEKCRTSLSLAVSHDGGGAWQRAGVVAGVLGPGLAPG